MKEKEKKLTKRGETELEGDQGNLLGLTAHNFKVQRDERGVPHGRRVRIKGKGRGEMW